MDIQLKNQTQKTNHCPRCESTSLQIICGEDETTSHWGRLECSNCGRWIKWLSKPKSQADLSRSQFINGLLLSSQLTAWERSFLRSIRNRNYLTCKQQRRFQEISKKVTGGEWGVGNGRSPP